MPRGWTNCQPGVAQPPPKLRTAVSLLRASPEDSGGVPPHPKAVSGKLGTRSCSGGGLPPEPNALCPELRGRGGYLGGTPPGLQTCFLAVVPGNREARSSAMVWAPGALTRAAFLTLL